MHSEILCSGYGGGIGAWYDGWGMVGWGGGGVLFESIYVGVNSSRRQGRWILVYNNHILSIQSFMYAGL